ncbi:thioredoxin family protein [Clostridium perfringens]|uniref:thioredoxin family protein n=1 Tax=Clostridium perfringens TaxID=1502 RepID=UPI00109469FA|nr:thioredoxin family protein [Clostridium perfringens]MDK0651536.1 thioredoxin family protein [Clostridium perfringens]MDM0627429.1 thioredoxin family protein [Clostridium perfringens]TGY43038.1 thioredoxin [Clostridium perfringens]
MKRLRVIILSISIILIISIFSNMYLLNKNIYLKKEINDVKNSISDTYNYLNSITVENFQKYVEENKDFYVYIGRPDCGDCMLFEPIFKNIVMENKLGDKIYYLNVKYFRENNESSWESFKNEYGFNQTPTIIHFKDGRNVSMIEWDDEIGLSRNRLLEWLEKEKII